MPSSYYTLIGTLAIGFYRSLTFDFINLKSSVDESGEIVTLREWTISLYSRFYTPRNSSSKCIATPPTIRRAHTTIGIVDIPIVLSVDSPIQPKYPRTIIMVGGVLAKTIPRRRALIFIPPLLKQFFRQRDGSSFSPHQWPRTIDLQNNHEKQKIEIKNTLIKLNRSEIDHLRSTSFYYSFNLTKKQSHSLPIRFQHASENKVGYDTSAIFPNYFINRNFYIKGMKMVYLNLANYKIIVTYVTHMEVVSLIKNELIVISYHFLETTSLSLTKKPKRETNSFLKQLRRVDD